MARFCFDDFCFDTDQRLLSRGDHPVRLTPRAFRLLELLLMRHPKAVSKAELLDSVWSGAIVEEANLKTLVREIRQALDERGGDSRAIRTVFGFGYAFSAPVRVEEESPVVPLVLLRWAEGVVRLPAGTHILGRAGTCTVMIDSPSVSREHARLAVSPDALLLTDLGSKNGTFVEGSRLHDTTPLLDCSRITIGEVAVDVARIGRETSTETLDRFDSR